MIVWKNKTNGVELFYEDGYWYFRFATGYTMTAQPIKRVLEILFYVELGIVI